MTYAQLSDTAAAWAQDRYAAAMSASVPAWAKPKPFPSAPGHMTPRARPNAGRKTLASRPEVRAQILAMFDAGLLRRDIASRVQVCIKTLRRVLIDAGRIEG